MHLSIILILQKCEGQISSNITHGNLQCPHIGTFICSFPIKTRYLKTHQITKYNVKLEV